MNSKDTNELKLARQYFFKSISLDSLNAETWNFVSYSYIQESKLTTSINVKMIAEAIKFYDKAVILDNKNSLYFYQRGYCYGYLGDSAKRDFDFKKSCDLGNSIACSILSNSNRK